ncbi:DNA-binding protein in cluster with Type I restriction-modification system [Aquipluma nitroreducens]|uniref:DNA-binding protein in cluster with Type I restriction-modification system n=1 Tax=Aquipluma nitroreducens TaxID=2010828 RepID=A0A5K7S977_9BACT|nr:virulence protein RhuM/Fic/DOC family protein [Aquipluma nitroreducens]BBE17874.1 DNA-binding protein in cluster with Type I restriction-modification system [Aquipluma nitroreducens]
MNNSEITIFKTEDGKTEIQVKLENETVWLNLMQMSELFSRDKSVISRHITNIFKEKELPRVSVVAKNATTALDGKTYQVEYYNLDVIISVGYRIKSQRGTQFRIWANKILKDYLIKGYSINEKRLVQQNEQLRQLQDSVKLLGQVLNHKELSGDESTGLLKIISDYAYALDILDQYDYQKLEITETSGKEIYQITYEEAISQIAKVKIAYGNSELFGREKDDSFKSSISTIYQTYNGADLYPSIEEKAANLLYFVTKNHSFSDGNKRIAAFLFLYFPDL